VQGITETITDTSWTLERNMTVRAKYNAWILGDAVYGVLDSRTRLFPA